jgi:hypothetical protein
LINQGIVAMNNRWRAINRFYIFTTSYEIPALAFVSIFPALWLRCYYPQLVL